MYAVIRTGGRQYRVQLSQVIDVATLSAPVGGQVEFPEVLLVADGQDVRVGNPTVPGAKVIAEVLERGGGPKVTVFKFKAKVRYSRKRGQRQPYTRLAIRAIVT